MDELYGDVASTAGQGQGQEIDTALYEGLFAGSVQAASGDTYLQHKVNELEELLREKTAEAASLRDKLNARDQQISDLTAERDTLLRNISVLFNTAKEEMARKLAEIAQLRVELHGGQSGLPTGSGQGPRQLSSVPARPALPLPVQQSTDTGRHTQQQPQQQQRDRPGPGWGRGHVDGALGTGSASATVKRGRDGSLEPERDRTAWLPDSTPRSSSGGGSFGGGSTGSYASSGGNYAGGSGFYGGGGAGYVPSDDAVAKRQRYGGSNCMQAPPPPMLSSQPPHYQQPPHPQARYF